MITLKSGKPAVPWSIQVEVVEGCNRRCWFCGLISLPPERKKGVNFLSLELAEKVFSELHEWIPKGIRIELNSHGEPTLHPDWFDLLRVMREAYPRASLNLQTNGEVWFKEGWQYLEEMFDAGLDVCVFNAYRKGLYEHMLEVLPDWAERSDFTWVDYYRGEEKVQFNRYWRPGSRMFFLLDDLGKMNETGEAGQAHKTNKRLHNSGGNGLSDAIAKKTGKKARELPLHSKCSKVFRELILSWDGTIPVCCQDWHTVLQVGDCREEHIRDIWYSERMDAIRRLLHRKRRDLLVPCRNCDDPTTRVGLCPDPGGEDLTEEELLRVIRDTTPQDAPNEQWVPEMRSGESKKKRRARVRRRK